MMAALLLVESMVQLEPEAEMQFPVMDCERTELCMIIANPAGHEKLAGVDFVAKQEMFTIDTFVQLTEVVGGALQKAGTHP
jgi:hypothetical protein